MTLHDAAIGWVAEHTGGFFNHSPVNEKSSYKVKRMEPDVVVKKKVWTRFHEWHEVEVLPVSANKLKVYDEFKNKKVLWIVLPEGTTNTFQLRVIEKNGLGFKQKKVWTGRRL